MTIPSEHMEQVRFVSWFRKTYPEHWIFAVPNGGNRNRVTAAQMKAEGVMRGVPDLFVPSMGLWIEMKRQKGGALSPDQKAWRDYLQQHNYRWILGKGFEDAKSQVINL